MGRRGPKKTPKETLEKRGSWRAKAVKKKRAPKKQAAVKLSIVKVGADTSNRPTMPQKLTGEARKIWIRLLPILERAGMLDENYRETLKLLCEAMEDYDYLEGLAKEQDPVLEGSNGYRYQNPTYVMKNKARDQVAKLAALFGMSPADVQGVRVTDKTKEDKGKSRFFEKNKA